MLTLMLHKYRTNDKGRAAEISFQAGELKQRERGARPAKLPASGSGTEATTFLLILPFWAPRAFSRDGCRPARGPAGPQRDVSPDNVGSGLILGSRS